MQPGAGAERVCKAPRVCEPDGLGCVPSHFLCRFTLLVYLWVSFLLHSSLPLLVYLWVSFLLHSSFPTITR